MLAVCDTLLLSPEKPDRAEHERDQSAANE